MQRSLTCAANHKRVKPMKRARFALVISAAFIGLLSTAGSAFALAAVAKSAVNVRTGPSVNYTRIDTLYAGEPVNVTECKSNGWCYVQQDGPDGWVSGNYLVRANPAPTHNPDPDVNFSIYFGTGGPAFGFSIGNPRPPVAPVFPKVCFFNGNNYSGASFCVAAGSQNSRLTGFWNNKISSVQVQPGARVQLCRNANYRGFCQTYSSSVPSLNPFLNNDVSSFKTY